jgi:hypothetical protein
VKDKKKIMYVSVSVMKDSDCVCLFPTGLKKGESRGQNLFKNNPSCAASAERRGEKTKELRVL